MSFGSFVRSIGRFFTASNLTAVEKWVAKAAPEFGAELTAFSQTLPRELASLEKMALQAIVLYKAAKGVTISKSLAIQLAQTVFTASSSDLVAEAEALLKK